MKDIVRYAAAKSPFFKKYYSGCNLNDIWHLPRVNKKIMMDNLGDYNTLGLDKDEITKFYLEVEKKRDFTKRLKGINIGMSSGTSGNRGVEIVTPREENYMKAALLSRFDFPKGEKINLAFILRVSAPAFNLDKFGHRLTYVSQLQPLEKIMAQLAAIGPNILSGPPSMLKLIAKEVEAGRLKIAPKRLISYAEVLYPDVRDYLGKVFNCPIREIYKCTEGPIAVSCPHGSLHINEDLVVLEALKDDGSPAAPGEPCERLVVTDLHKRSQPIIRYDLNDIVTISPQKCSCGSNFRVIERIQGRADDMFWGIRKDGSGSHFIYQDYISRAIISTSEAIDDYQAIQEDYCHVVLRIKTKIAGQNDLASNLVGAVRGVFSSYGCQEPEVKVVFGDPLRNEFSNKLARIICKIKNQ